MGKVCIEQLVNLKIIKCHMMKWLDHRDLGAQRRQKPGYIYVIVCSARKVQSQLDGVV